MPIARFQFYLVDTPGKSLHDAVEELYTYPCSERACSIDGNPCLLLDNPLDFKESKACLFTRLRMDGLPDRVGMDGTKQPLDLEDDEGLGEDVAMAYHKSLNVVSIQRNRFSLSANNIATFFTKLFPGMNISFIPILSADALERFARLNTLRKYRIKVAGTDDLSFLSRDETLSEDQKIAIIKMLENPYLDYTVSMGYKKGGLTNENVKILDFFRRFSQTEKGSEVVRVLQITGKENDESSTVSIDLISESLTYEQPVNTVGRAIDTNHLLRIARASLIENYEELSNAYIRENS